MTINSVNRGLHVDGPEVKVTDHTTKTVSNLASAIVATTEKPKPLLSFAEAIAQENWDIANSWIKYKPDVNAKLPSGETLFYIACQAGEWDLVDQMCALNPNVNEVPQGKVSPLQKAAADDELGIINKLLDHEADINYSVKNYLLGPALFSILMDFWNDPDNSDINQIIDRMSGLDPKNNYRPGFGYYEGFSSLHLSACLGKNKLTRKFLADDPSINEASIGTHVKGLTPFLAAVNSQNWELVEDMLKYKPDLKASFQNNSCLELISTSQTFGKYQHKTRILTELAKSADLDVFTGGLLLQLLDKYVAKKKAKQAVSANPALLEAKITLSLKEDIEKITNHPMSEKSIGKAIEACYDHINEFELRAKKTNKKRFRNGAFFLNKYREIFQVCKKYIDLQKELGSGTDVEEMISIFRCICKSEAKKSLKEQALKAFDETFQKKKKPGAKKRKKAAPPKELELSSEESSEEKKVRAVVATPVKKETPKTVGQYFDTFLSYKGKSLHRTNRVLRWSSYTNNQIRGLPSKDIDYSKMSDEEIELSRRRHNIPFIGRLLLNPLFKECYVEESEKSYKIKAELETPEGEIKPYELQVALRRKDNRIYHSYLHSHKGKEKMAEQGLESESISTASESGMERPQNGIVEVDEESNIVLNIPIYDSEKETYKVWLKPRKPINLSDWT